MGFNGLVRRLHFLMYSMTSKFTVTVGAWCYRLVSRCGTNEVLIPTIRRASVLVVRLCFDALVREGVCLAIRAVIF